MTTRLFKDFGGLAIVGICFLIGSAANAAPTGNIEICHKPGDRSQSILNVNPSSLPGHEGHGDYVVEPEVCDGQDSDCDMPIDPDNDVDCSDGVACTVDTCGGLPGCFNTPDDSFCDDGNPNTTDSCDAANTNADTRGCVIVGNVFLTSERYTGDLISEAIAHGIGAQYSSGLEAGDAICNYHASEASLVGTWVAWLSDSSTDAIDRISQIGPYVRTDGAQIAADIDDLTDGTLANQINKNEFGMRVPSGIAAWTGTDGDGLKLSRYGYAWCTDWTSESSPDLAWVGNSRNTNLGWTEYGGDYCTTARPLYCFRAEDP